MNIELLTNINKHNFEIAKFNYQKTIFLLCIFGSVKYSRLSGIEPVI